MEIMETNNIGKQPVSLVKKSKRDKTILKIRIGERNGTLGIVWTALENKYEDVCTNCVKYVEVTIKCMLFCENIKLSLKMKISSGKIPWKK